MSRLIRVLLITIAATGALLPASAAAEQPVVRAILFWSETCPHCHYVIDEVLPPIQARYGQQFRIKMLEGRQSTNASVYRAAVQLFGIPPERQVVPALVIGDRALVGSLEIPDQLVNEIERYLSVGGVDYPSLPGLDQAVATEMCGAGPCTDSQPAAAPEPALPATDPLANTLAGAVLLGLAGVLVYAPIMLVRVTRRVAQVIDTSHPRASRRQSATDPRRAWWSPIILLLALAGLGVASYLAYTKLAHADVACGPVGDCDAVQVSPYSELFGIPVAILGGLTYVGILACWVVYRLANGTVGRVAHLALWGLALVGAAFSFYLTFLEPFVIGAVCVWCLASAICMALILLLASRSIDHHIGSALRPLAKTGDYRRRSV